MITYTPELIAKHAELLSAYKTYSDDLKAGCALRTRLNNEGRITSPEMEANMARGRALGEAVNKLEKECLDLYRPIVVAPVLGVATAMEFLQWAYDDGFGPMYVGPYMALDPESHIKADERFRQWLDKPCKSFTGGGETGFDCNMKAGTITGETFDASEYTPAWQNDMLGASLLVAMPVPCEDHQQSLWQDKNSDKVFYVIDTDGESGCWCATRIELA